MTTYTVQKVGDVSPITLTPQPTSTGIQVSRRTYSGNGTILEEGKYIELKWSILDKADYQAILEDFGLDTDTTNTLDVGIRDEFLDDITMEGTAIRPQMGSEVEWRNSFLRDITILVRDLN